MTATHITAEPTYYEVSWGIQEHEHQTYIDNGDKSFLSADAEARATRAWLDLTKQGIKAGLFVNGAHKAGHDFADEWASWDVEANRLNKEWDEYVLALAPVEHKTRTFLHTYETHLNWRKVQIVGDPTAWAVCSCGWKVLRDNRDLARRAAREHRQHINAPKESA